jgi:hypothetical protein
MMDSWDPVKASPYIIMDISYISDDDLAGYMDALPSTLMEKDIMVSWSDDKWTYRFTSVLTPAFTISHLGWKFEVGEFDVEFAAELRK